MKTEEREILQGAIDVLEDIEDDLRAVAIKLYNRGDRFVGQRIKAASMFCARAKCEAQKVLSAAKRVKA